MTEPSSEVLQATAPRLTGERPRLLTGTVLGERIRVGEIIGSGGMGVVYEGHHDGLGTKVAIKVLHLGGDTEGTRRFRTEAKALANLRHPHIVSVLDFGVTSDGTNYMVLERLEGRSADSVLNHRGHLPWRWVFELLRQILLALEVAHEMGVVHRDVKPNNCFCVGFESVDAVPEVKLLDFGVAKLLGEDLTHPKTTRAGELIGTAAYMSPEQASGGVIDARSDLYSVGATAYELLTGVPIFQGASSVDLLYQHVHAQPRSLRESNPRAGVPPAVEALVLRAVSKDPEARPADARTFRKEVESLLARADDLEQAPQPTGGNGRKRGPVLALGASALAMGLGAWWWLGGDVPTGRSCADLHEQDPELPSGRYSIDPDAEGVSPEFEVYCDMERDGGGWTLVGKVHRAHTQGVAGLQTFLSLGMNQHLLLGDEPPPDTEPLVSSHGQDRLTPLVAQATTARFVVLAQDDPLQRAAWFKRVDVEGFFSWFTSEAHAPTDVCLDPEMRESCRRGRISSEERDMSGAQGRVTVLEGMNLSDHGYDARGDLHLRLSADDHNYFAGVCSHTFFDEGWNDSLDAHWGNGLEIWLR